MGIPHPVNLAASFQPDPWVGLDLNSETFTHRAKRSRMTKHVEQNRVPRGGTVSNGATGLQDPPNTRTSTHRSWCGRRPHQLFGIPPIHQAAPVANVSSAWRVLGR